MPLILEIVVGSIVQCTKNVSTSVKLANGSIGTDVAFTTACDDVVKTSVLDGVEEYYHSVPPDIVFVRLKDYASHQFVPSLPPGVVPLCKRKETGVQIQMQQRTFSISICQIPVVPAYSLTTEKCQGLTVDKMILAPLQHSTRRVPQHSSFYVAVTRVTTLKQLYLMEPLTKKFLEYFVPNGNAL
ncbi:hypothetical protein DVH05_001219 [Phytophthora capsici]|nr:hypothetical protein DVH05_001219 [Phytophthora capsici]